MNYRDVLVKRSHKRTWEIEQLVWCLSGRFEVDIIQDAKVRCERLTDDSEEWAYEVSRIGQPGEFDHLLDSGFAN